MSSTASQHRSSATGSLAGSFAWTLIWLLGTAAICWHAASQFTPRVEDRILSRIQSVLTPLTSASTPVVASVHGRDATLTGRVVDKQQRARLLAAIEGIPGVRSVEDQLTLLEPLPASDKNDTGDSTRDSDVSETTDEATTLTVIDSSSSESSSESVDQLTENSSTDDIAVGNDNSDNTDNLASGVASLTTEPVDPKPNTDLLTDTESAFQTGSDIKSDADSIEEPSPQELETTVTKDTKLAVANIESNDQTSLSETESTSLLPPSLDFNIEGKTLAVSGKLSNNDDIAPLIRTAMVTFDLDYISNTIELSDEIENASWLESVSELLPDMAGLENPSIEINKDDIHLGGSAPNTETQDAVLGTAVSVLGAYNMSEDIALKKTDPPAPIADENTESNVTQEPTALNETKEIAGAVDTANEGDTNITTTDATDAVDVASEDDTNITTTDATDAVDAANEGDTNITTTDATDAVDVASEDDTNIATTEDSDAIGEPSDQADDKIKTSLSASPADALKNAFNDLPSMDILFESSSDILTIESLDVLDSIADVLVNHPDIPIRIEGHTDASGTKQDNLILSQLRANSVRDYLVDRGVSIYRLKAYGFGEGVPISDNSTPDGRADNRRIEFNVQR